MKNTMRRTTATMGIFVASVLALGALVTVAALAFTGDTGPNLPEPLPPMTLTYEVNGPGVSVGDRVIADYKETRRLEYRSQTEWTETVIESPQLDLGRYGTGTNEGSYQKLNGSVLTEYDAMIGTTDTSSVGAGVFLPLDALGYAYTPVGSSPLKDTVTTEAVTMDVRVCAANGVCADNVPGTKYTAGSGRELVVYEGADFVLPVRSGHFVLKSVLINGP